MGIPKFGATLFAKRVLVGTPRRMYVCTHAGCLHTCMYVCVCVYTCMNVCRRCVWGKSESNIGPAVREARVGARGVWNELKTKKARGLRSGCVPELFGKGPVTDGQPAQFFSTFTMWGLCAL